MALIVAHLFEHPDHRRLVAGWIFDAFWRERPESDLTIASFGARLADATEPDRIPLSLLALVDGRPAGTVNLIENDDSKRSYLRPWLAALVVAPQFRRAGIGSALVRALCDHAARLDIPELYLGTDIPDFYRRLGAVLVERDGDHHVMRLPT